MFYINSKYQGTIETVDQCKTRKEAKFLLAEYVMAFGPDFELWISSRSTKEWREK